MKDLQQIKDEVAKERGYRSFYEMQFPYDMVCEEDINEIAKRYAEEAIRECAERARVFMPSHRHLHYTENVNKEEILSLINELK